MRHFLPLLLLLTGCAASPEQWTPGGLLLGIGSIATIGRTPVDALLSIVSGRDCSVMWLDKGQSYCREPEPPPGEPAFCTRSLGQVDCWKDASALPGHPRGVADGPTKLTPAQERDRTKGWLF